MVSPVRETAQKRSPIYRHRHWHDGRFLSADSLSRGTGLQTQVREDLVDDWLLQDGCDDLQLATAVRAVLEVQIEDALEQPRPT
jgi:hypothetical protein